MSEHLKDESSSPPRQQTGGARAKLSQLQLRAEAMQPFIAADGEPFRVRTRMGLEEWWRIVEPGKDPMCEQVPAP